MPDLVTTSPESATPPPISRRAVMVARIVTGVLLVSVPLMMTVICWRWATVHEPSAAVVIFGDASVDEAEVVVTGNNRKFTVSLTHENNWESPIMLDAGAYHIRATHRGRVILESDFLLESLRGVTFNLPSLVWVDASPLVADARIEISRELADSTVFPTTELKVNSQDSYRTSIYLLPGAYRIIARNMLSPDHVIAHVEFTVEHTVNKPMHVDLGKAALEGRAE